LQTVADLGELSRSEVDALLLDLGALLLAVSTPLLADRALLKSLELVRHLLDGSREVGQLTSNERRVFSGRHVRVGRILRHATTPPGYRFEPEPVCCVVNKLAVNDTPPRRD
jgi:hypothetical protein